MNDSSLESFTQNHHIQSIHSIIEWNESLKEAVKSCRQAYFSYYTPHQKQRDFHRLGLDADIRLFIGANRSGKTLAAGIETAAGLTGRYPESWEGFKFDRPINAWVIGQTAAETKNTLIAYYIEGANGYPPLIHPELIVYRNDTEKLYYIRHKSGGLSKLRFKSYDQKRKAFQAEALDLIHADEETPYDIFQECLMRLAPTRPGITTKMLISAMCLRMSPFVLRFTQGQDDAIIPPNKVVNGNAYIINSWDDISHLSEDFKRNLLATMPSHEIGPRTQGLPSIGSGLVYPIPESLITCPPFPIPDFWPRFFAIDYGWTNPTALLFGAIDRDNDVVYFYSEYYAKEKTPQQHMFELLKYNVDRIPGVKDPSGMNKNIMNGKDISKIYEECGMRNVLPANNAKEEGVQRVLQRMQNGKLLIFNTLRHTLSELRMYSRDEEGIIMKGNDHLMDCMRYGIMSALPIARPLKDKHDPFDDYSYARSGGYL